MTTIPITEPEITTIVDVHVDPDEPCYPMIPPGAAAVDVIDAEDVRRARESDASVITRLSGCARTYLLHVCPEEAVTS